MSPRKSRTGFFTLPIALFPLVTMFLRSASVTLLQRLSNICFLHAPLGQSVLSWLQSLMVNASPLCPSLLCRHVLFDFTPDELHCVPRIFVYILNVCKFYIWRTCNDFRFRDVPPSALDLSVCECSCPRLVSPSLVFSSLFPSSMVCQGCHCLAPARPFTHSPLIF